MPSKSLYRVQEVTGDHVRISKFDLDMEVQGSYDVRQKPNGDWKCDCPAAIDNCRHKKIIQVWQTAVRTHDKLMKEASDDGKYAVFLSFDGKMFDWIRGHENVEIEF